jgi:hypothetical protein
MTFLTRLEPGINSKKKSGVVEFSLDDEDLNIGNDSRNYDELHQPQKSVSINESV